MHAISNKIEQTTKTTLLLLLQRYFHSSILATFLHFYENFRRRLKAENEERRKTDAKYPRENARGRNIPYSGALT